MDGEDLMAASIAALETMADRLDASYGDCCEASEIMNVAAGQGTLKAICEFVRRAVVDG